MSNRILTRHGVSIPVFNQDGSCDLQPYELGYCTSNEILYIRKQDDSVDKIHGFMPIEYNEDLDRYTISKEVSFQDSIHSPYIFVSNYIQSDEFYASSTIFNENTLKWADTSFSIINSNSTGLVINSDGVYFYLNNVSKDILTELNYKDYCVSLSGDSVVDGAITANQLRANDTNGIITFASNAITTTANTLTLNSQNGVVYLPSVSLAYLTCTQNVIINGSLDANTIDCSNELTASRVRITSTADASLSSTAHGLQIGPTNGLNLIIDQNEILPRNNGSAAGLNIGESTSIIYISGTVNLATIVLTSKAYGSSVPSGTGRLYFKTS